MNPVYQMIFEPNNNHFGLIFSEETEEFNQPVFVLPTTGNQNWIDKSYYFPGEINGQVRDFELKFENGLFILIDKDLKYPLRFAIGLYNFYPDKRYLVNEVLRNGELKYIGNHQKLVTPFDKFIVITPLDLLIMDFMFKESKACFVGLTPSFGIKREIG